MKFLILDDCGGAHYYYKIGFVQALQACGHQGRIYTGYGQNVKPLMDEFYEYRPDVFYSNTYSLTEEQLRVAAKYPETKWILFASAWGDILNIGPEYEIVRVTDKQKKMVERLKQIASVEFVFIHFHNNNAKYVIGDWEQLGIKYVGIPNAVNTFIYANSQYREELACDIAYVDDYWPYKGKNINRYFFPIIPKYRCKIFGGGWNIPEHLGYITDETSRDLFRSAKITPSFSEPQATTFGFDIVQRPFQAAVNGCSLVISDYVESFKKDFFGDAILMAKTPSEFEEMVEYYMRHDDERQKKAKELSEIVIRQDTYFNRLATIFENIGESEEANKVLKIHKDWLESYNV